ncbi:MAG: hypothetical protein AVDCRST_MAG56-3248 [uncultured Cytophagales bacterium]|uniref:Fatty acid desaturase domain-containing protein n=1 Tax=uncultured Cytophagales bacterium TaxID=158755 RepID=A0A6J4JB81_9SPHI|nr:MAG: hypothetical protein AVDCRST_MAG56-3248 [uncultured Cytophagales bacterium]
MQKATWTQIRSELKQSYSPVPSLAILAVDLLMLAASWHFSYQGTVAGWLLGQFLLVIALIHVYVIHHEAVHHAVFERRVHNEILGHLLSLLIAMPFLPRRHSHLHHHSWSGNVNDPSHRRIIEKLSKSTAGQLRLMDLMWALYLPFLALNERLAFWRMPFQQWKAGDRTGDVRQERAYALGYLAVYGLLGILLAGLGVLGAFAAWFLPATFILLFVEEMINLPHHIDIPMIDTPKPLPLWEQDQTTHSCQSVPLWSSLILLNFNMHTAHHLFPWIPWHKLPQAQQHMQRYAPELGEENTDEFSWLRKRRTFAITDKFIAHLKK